MTQPMPGDPAPRDLSRYALVVVDVQQGFSDPTWGRRNNPGCEANVTALLREWQQHHRPVVVVRHDSTSPDSPLHPASAGNQLLDAVASATADLLVTKSVNSSFHGSPDLHTWLQGEGIGGIVVCGITTNHCCETTARVGGNLGYDVLFPLDATHTFDRIGPDGGVVDADTLARVTATNLHGEFATVVSTQGLLAGGGC